MRRRLPESRAHAARSTTSAPEGFARSLRTETVRHLWILFAVALLARANSFGDPNYHADETFYLMVGKAMHAGMSPYLDIWDRKPPGLFVLYWVLAGISGSVLSFQIAGFLFTVATGAVVVRIARRWSGGDEALLGGCLYIAYLQPLLGGGGQSPVFYNLFVCTAVLLLIQAAEQPQPSRIFGRGVGAALLSGIAVAVKPTAVFEGMFVVLGFAWLEWNSRRNPTCVARLLLTTGLGAALPVIAMVAWYTARGELGIFLQATVVSNFQKDGAPTWLFVHTARYLLVIMCPIATCAWLGWFTARRDLSDRRLFGLISLWLVAALAGFLSVPNFYSHYALPVVPVLAVLSARYFSTKRLGQYLALFVIGWALWVGQSLDLTRGMRSKARFERAAEVIRTNLHGGPLYVFDGPPSLYSATASRWTGRFVFPEHLSNAIERRALGTDARGELTRVLGAKPDVIVVTSSPKPTLNTENFNLLQGELTRNYRLVCTMPAFDFEHHYWMYIFARSRPERSQCKA